MKVLIISLMLLLMDFASSREVGIPQEERTRYSRDVASNDRISKKKCQEYKDLLASTSIFGSLPLYEEPTSSLNIFKEYDCSPFIGLIIGGEKTAVGEFPHMAAIGWDNPLERQIDFLCGGSLISEKFVLTVAHCSMSKGKPPTIVRLGDQNLLRSDDGAKPVDYEIKKFIPHERYSSETKLNDIALIELKNVVQIITNLIRPACLCLVENIANMVVATGWGKTESDSPGTQELLKVSLDIVDSKSCWISIEDGFSDRISPGKISPTQICAGGKRNKDTCTGDSGGPIQIAHADAPCVYDIVGLTSYGAAADCGTLRPAVYTRVQSYLDWIENIVWPNN